MFSTLYGTYLPFYMLLKMSTAICFNLDQSKILSFGEEFRFNHKAQDMESKRKSLEIVMNIKYSFSSMELLVNYFWNTFRPHEKLFYDLHALHESSNGILVQYFVWEPLKKLCCLQYRKFKLQITSSTWVFHFGNGTPTYWYSLNICIC